MTNETKPSTRRQVAEITLILAAIAAMFLVPITRAALTTSWEAFVEVVRQTPGQVLAGLENAWNWIF